MSSRTGLVASTMLSTISTIWLEKLSKLYLPCTLAHLPGFNAAEMASAWACTLAEFSRLRRALRNSLQLTEPV